jgi:hypothetical protein
VRSRSSRGDKRRLGLQAPSSRRDARNLDLAQRLARRRRGRRRLGVDGQGRGMARFRAPGVRDDDHVVTCGRLLDVVGVTVVRFISVPYGTTNLKARIPSRSCTCPSRSNVHGP